MYLNSLLMQFPCDPNDPYTFPVTVTINDTELVFAPERLDGGQRLKMPQEATETIVAALCGGTCVDLTAGRYQETLTPDNFAPTYRLLLK